MSAEILTIVISTISLFVLVMSSMGGMFAWQRKDLQKQFDRIDAQFDKIDTQFDRVDAQFVKVDDRFDKVDARFERADDQSAEIRSDLADLKIVVARIDERLTIVEGRPRSLVIATH